MTGDEHEGGAGLLGWAQEVRARSQTYAAHAARAAESATVIAGQVDRMIAQMAERNPDYAGRLQEILVTAAGQRAAIAECKRSHQAGRPDRGPVPAPPNGPAAAAAPGPDRPLPGDGHLQDEVIHRVFAAGLTLQGTTELAAEPEVHWRIEAAVDELDDLVRVVRDALFH